MKSANLTPPQRTGAHLHQALVASASLGRRRKAVVAEVESRYLKELMAATGGDVPRACALSGVSRPRLCALLKK